jgi:AraC-like DNA-binding protein
VSLCLPGDVQPIGLRYLEPAPELRGYISSYYVFWADLPKVTDVVRADLPQLRFMLAGRGEYSFANGSIVSTPETSLIGPTMGASHFSVRGPLLVFGVAILPAGWAALVRDDASRHADGIADASAVFGPLLNDALDAMRSANGFDVMVSIADAVMRVLVSGAADAPLWFTRMTDSWLTGAASPEVDELVNAAGMSSRQVERLARRIYGAPPKLLARKYRALRAASLLGLGNLVWQEAAGDSFYDQSHFIREIKHFTGLTPRQFQRDMPPVIRLSLQRRALTGRLPELALVS